MNRPQQFEPRPQLPETAGAAAWKRALKGVAASALRLHRYRFIRTRMLHDALTAAREGAEPGSSER